MDFIYRFSHFYFNKCLHYCKFEKSNVFFSVLFLSNNFRFCKNLSTHPFFGEESANIVIEVPRLVVP